VRFGFTAVGHRITVQRPQPKAGDVIVVRVGFIARSAQANQSNPRRSATPKQAGVGRGDRSAQQLVGNIARRALWNGRKVVDHEVLYGIA
jgi:hypothetical protein